MAIVTAVECAGRIGIVLPDLVNQALDRDAVARVDGGGCDHGRGGGPVLVYFGQRQRRRRRRFWIQFHIFTPGLVCHN